MSYQLNGVVRVCARMCVVSGPICCTTFTPTTSFSCADCSLSNAQECGEEEEGGVVYRVQLKRTRYHSLGQEDTAHLSYETTKVRMVKAGRLEGLVGCLAPTQGLVDPLYLNCFLCTYQTFTTPEALVEQLVQR